MSLHLTKLISLLILALLIGCSSGDGGEPSTVVVVTADGANNGDSTASTDTDTGSVTDSDTGGQDTGSENTDAGDGTSTASESDTDTAGAVTTSGNVDAGADDGADSTAGTATDGTATTSGTTDSSDTDAGTDGVDDTTTGSVTSGTTGDIGTTTDGTATDTAGSTTGTETDAGADTAGTDAGATDGATSGTTSGTDTDGTGTSTTGTTDYPIGSLASVLNNDPELTSAFEAIQDANFDLAIDNPDNEFTLFLPNNDAFEDLASPSDFILLGHTASGAVSSATLAALNGRGLLMDDGQRLVVEGGGAEPLTIAGVEVTSVDIMGNTSTTVVHVIDSVIGDQIDSSPYPSGSLADVLFNRGDVTNALAALKAVGLDEALNDLSNTWTVFLPNDTALDDPADFNAQVHIYTLGVNDSQFFTDISGLPLLMNSGDLFDIGGGGTEDLTIGGATFVEADVQNEDGDGMIVHIIDGVLEPQ